MKPLPQLVRIKSFSWSAIIAIALWVMLATWSPARAADEPVELKAGHPDRYAVKEGDTLWGIAQKFLKDPWRWPEIWQRNPKIENPHLIFPGDVLVLTVVDGKPQIKALRTRKVTKLGPQTRQLPLDDAIPTIPPSAIQAFLRQPLVLEQGNLSEAGYVASGREGTIALGKYSVFYARGLPEDSGKFYKIVRPARPFIDPVTREFLGLHVTDVGDAKMLVPGPTAKLEVIRSNLEVSPGDRMIPAPKDIGLPYFHPRAPDREVRGTIIDGQGIAEVGSLLIVVVNLGQRDGMEPGHVLRILREEAEVRDPVTGHLFKPPLEPNGLLMLFRVFNKVSYGLILNSRFAVHLKDAVETP